MTKVQSMTRISTSIKLACFALLTLFTLSVVAQNADTANLRGTVKDPSGAVVRNASLTLLDPSRNVSRTAQTNEDGEYLFANVPPGTYSLSVTEQSYVKKKAHIRLPVGETVTLPTDLAASGGESTVDVTASAAIVDTQKSAVSNVINQKQIDDLPIN